MDKRPHADRDAGFERLLRETLRGDESAAGSECVEPDTLAAWSEGVLSPSERSFVEAHAARCLRCQSMLAALARTVPVEPERAAWGVRQWLMMFAPAAAAATAIALWFAVEPRRAQLEQPAQQVADAHVPASPSSTAAPANPVVEEARASGERRDAPAAAPGGQVAPAPTDAAAPARERRATQLADARKKVDSRATDAFERPRQELDRLAAEAKRDQAASANAGFASAKPVVEMPTAPPPPPAAVAPGSITTTVTAQSPTVQTSQASVQQQQAATSDQQQAASLRAGAAGRGGGGRALERAALNESIVVAPLVIAPANSSVQWRVVSERIVQQSADKGATYATQYTLDEKSTITAGSSPMPLVAWLVGRSGLVIVTVDGRTWRRISFPEPVDLVSVLAIDARTATVTASDRRSFTTTDAGASWTAVKD
jgi:hypothetical protein